jgi:hypothetical protein
MTCQKALSSAGKTINDCLIPPEALDELVDSSTAEESAASKVKKFLAEMFVSGRSAADCERKSMEQLRCKRHLIMRRSNRRESQSRCRFQSR